MAILPPTFRQRYFSAGGLPLAGGKMYTYAAGTTTPLATYTDATEASSNTNPIILDANGECNLWLGGFAYKIVLTDSNDVTQWTQDNINQSDLGSPVQADLLENLGIVCTVPGGGVLTISLKTGAGNTPSIADPVRIGFRGGSLASGLVSLVNITGPLAMNVVSGATLGQTSGVEDYTYVYLINNNGAAELAVSSSIYQESSLISTTVMSTSSDSDSSIYSTVARTSLPIRLIARLTMTQATAGVWASAPTEIQTGEEARRAQIDTSQIANNAITNAKMADNSVNTAEIVNGAVTSAKLAAVGQQISASCGTFNHSSVSFADVTNLTVTITTTGRPVFVGLQADTSGSGGNYITGTGSSISNIRVLRDSTVLSESSILNGGSYYPFSVISYLDTPAAGTYTYKIQASTSGTQVTFARGKLYAYEL